jgi:tRNA U34 2-thiouridine synthase MnmA/TrmU
MAQDHSAHHGKASDAKPADPHAQMMKQHEGFLHYVVMQRAALKLTDAQVAKVEAYAKKVEAHHKEEAAHAAAGHKIDAAHEKKMHDEFELIFTDAQKEQLKALKTKFREACVPNSGKTCPVH